MFVWNKKLKLERRTLRISDIRLFLIVTTRNGRCDRIFTDNFYIFPFVYYYPLNRGLHISASYVACLWLETSRWIRAYFSHSAVYVSCRLLFLGFNGILVRPRFSFRPRSPRNPSYVERVSALWTNARIQVISPELFLRQHYRRESYVKAKFVSASNAANTNETRVLLKWFVFRTIRKRCEER